MKKSMAPKKQDTHRLIGAGDVEVVLRSELVLRPDELCIGPLSGSLNSEPIAMDSRERGEP